MPYNLYLAPSYTLKCGYTKFTMANCYSCVRCSCLCCIYTRIRHSFICHSLSFSLSACATVCHRDLEWDQLKAVYVSSFPMLSQCLLLYSYSYLEFRTHRHRFSMREFELGNGESGRMNGKLREEGKERNRDSERRERAQGESEEERQK